MHNQTHVLDRALLAISKAQPVDLSDFFAAKSPERCLYDWVSQTILEPAHARLDAGDKPSPPDDLLHRIRLVELIMSTCSPSWTKRQRATLDYCYVHLLASRTTTQPNTLSQAVEQLKALQKTLAVSRSSCAMHSHVAWTLAALQETSAASEADWNEVASSLRVALHVHPALSPRGLYSGAATRIYAMPDRIREALLNDLKRPLLWAYAWISPITIDHRRNMVPSDRAADRQALVVLLLDCGVQKLHDFLARELGGLSELEIGPERNRITRASEYKNRLASIMAELTLGAEPEPVQAQPHDIKSAAKLEVAIASYHAMRLDSAFQQLFEAVVGACEDADFETMASAMSYICTHVGFAQGWHQFDPIKSLYRNWFTKLAGDRLAGYLVIGQGDPWLDGAPKETSALPIETCLTLLIPRINELKASSQEKSEAAWALVAASADRRKCDSIDKSVCHVDQLQTSLAEANASLAWQILVRNLARNLIGINRVRWLIAYFDVLHDQMKSLKTLSLMPCLDEGVVLAHCRRLVEHLDKALYQLALAVPPERLNDVTAKSVACKSWHIMCDCEEHANVNIALNQSEAILDWIVGEKGGVLVVMRGADTFRFELNLTPEYLTGWRNRMSQCFSRDAREHFPKHALAPLEADAPFVNSQAEQRAARLWQELSGGALPQAARKMLMDVKRVWVCPSGLLANLPIHCLQYDEDSVLFERFDSSYLVTPRRPLRMCQVANCAVLVSRELHLDHAIEEQSDCRNVEQWLRDLHEDCVGILLGEGSYDADGEAQLQFDYGARVGASDLWYRTGWLENRHMWIVACESGRRPSKVRRGALPCERSLVLSCLASGASGVGGCIWQVGRKNALEFVNQWLGVCDHPGSGSAGSRDSAWVYTRTMRERICGAESVTGKLGLVGSFVWYVRS